MNRLVTFFLLIATIFLVIFSFKVFESYKVQSILLMDINNSSFEYLDNSENIKTSYPNVGVTSMNLNTIKASYYIKSGDFEKALELLNKVSYDPLGMTDVKKAEIYHSLNMYDSLYIYAQRAFNKIPNNSAHVIWYLKALSLYNEYNKIISLFPAIYEYGNERDLYFYFATVYNFKEQNFNDLILSQALETKVKYEKSKFEELNIILNYIIYGEENFKEYLKLNEKANAFFSQKLFIEAKSIYSSMIRYEINLSDTKYNIMVCDYYLENYDHVIELYSNLINEENDNTGRFEFLLARTYMNLKNNDLACNYLNKAISLGTKNIESYKKNICQN